MRSKADAYDYRYFPEPDLPPLQLTEETVNASVSNLIGTTYAKMKLYKDQYGFNKEFINGLVGYKEINELFEGLVAQ